MMLIETKHETDVSLLKLLKFMKIHTMQPFILFAWIDITNVPKPTFLSNEFI